MKLYRLLLPFLVVVMIIAGCKREIDFEYRDIDPILVIEGRLTETSPEIVITWTTPMDEPMDRSRVTDAAVALTDLTTGESTILSPDEDGAYSGAGGGVPGHLYRLTVEHRGKTFQSESRMGETAEITGMEFNWIKMPYDDVAVLQVSFRDDPAISDECYWLRILRNGKAYKWVTVNDLAARDGIIDQVMMTTRRDTAEEDEEDILEDGDVVTALLAPVSREMYDYLGALSVGNSNGPAMFEGDFCLGYFLAAPVSRRSVVFDKNMEFDK